ncbi:Legumin B, putative isoform 1 [Theobroma cacao]|uniref:Legumin B, putative isoform 1 n=1 Tax=Theobroma cacao TaxID=3641 RepID=A0A061ENV1_THECC|nr:Legumin B, putative isoform 1 [Theobroma cacao]
MLLNLSTVISQRLVSLSSGIKMKNNSSVLLLPSFAINSTAKAFYYLHLPMLLSLSMLFQTGQAIQGTVFPGCPETYQSQSQQSQHGGDKQQSSWDQHQKIRRLSWSRLLMLAIRPTSSIKTLEGLVTGGQSQSQGRSRRGQEEEQQESGGNNLLSAFKEQLLAEVFGIDTRLARKIQNEKDNRGAIVKVAHEFRFASPQSVEEEQRQRGSESEEEEEEEGQEERGQRRERREQRRGNRKQEGRQGRKGGSRSCNGLEETFCTMRLRHWTDSPFADVFNPRAGRITTKTECFLRSSLEHQCVTRGSGRIQVVAENGNAIFDDQVEEGQVIIVPQNHAVVKKAGRQGFERTAFKTNANPMISQFAGRVSVFRSIPVDVLASSFGISREDAMRLKQNRQEVSLFSPRKESQQ